MSTTSAPVLSHIRRTVSCAARSVMASGVKITRRRSNNSANDASTPLFSVPAIGWPGTKRAGACDEVVGCGRDEASLQRAVELGVIDRYHTDPAQAVKDADVGDDG